MRVHCIQTLVKHIYIVHLYNAYMYHVYKCIPSILLYVIFHCFLQFFFLPSILHFLVHFLISHSVMFFLQIRLYSIHLQYTYFMFIMNKLLLKLFCYCVQILFFINVTTTCYLFGIWFQFFVCVFFLKFCQGL